VIGFLMLLAVAVALNRHPDRGRSQYVAIIVAILLSSALGALAKANWDIVWSLDAGSHRAIGGAAYFLRDWLRYALPGSLIAGAYLYLRAEAETAALTHQCDVDAERMAREVAEARLRVLEAQIEPHFLFNTLASVKRLYRTDAGAGARTLDNLMRYFSVALPQMRSPERTLAGECALASAYLEIQRMRMGRRMAFTLDVPQALHAAGFPPFMLLTLVENSVKHGLDPMPEGGRIDVTVRASDGTLQVEVRDTGRGFTHASGAGTGLAGIRARLRLLYGDKADLSLGANEPRGVVATLVVPRGDADMKARA
jgi:LytS/YehU family sensor histidine kinase